MEKAEWKPFRRALDKKERKEFDEMWDIAKLYASACSNSVQLVALQPIVMSILSITTKSCHLAETFLASLYIKRD
jgi:hypothetical protein